MTLLGIALCIIGILLLSHSLQRQSLIRALAREVRSSRERGQELSIRLDDLTTKLNNSVTQLSKQSGMVDRRVLDLEERFSKGKVGQSGLALVSEADRELEDRLYRLELLADSPGTQLGLEAEAPAPAAPGAAPASAPIAENSLTKEPQAPTLLEVLTPWRELLTRDMSALASASSQGGRKFLEMMRKALKDHELDALLSEEAAKQIAAKLSALDSGERAQALSPSFLASIFENRFREMTSTSEPFLWKPPSNERRLRTLLLVGAELSGKTTAAVGLAHEALRAGAHVIVADCSLNTRAAGVALTTWQNARGLDIVAPIVNSKPHHVAYKAIHRAQDEKSDVLILDTPAGLTPKGKVSDAVTNIAAMIAREQPYPAHDTILVLSAASPKDSIAHGKRFLAEGSFSGLLLTHLDKMPSPGILFAISDALRIPLWYFNYGASGREIVAANPVVLSKALWNSSPPEVPNNEPAERAETEAELRP